MARKQYHIVVVLAINNKWGTTGHATWQNETFCGDYETPDVLLLQS